MRCKLRVDDCQNLIDQSYTFVYTFHAASHISRTFMGDAAIEGGKSFSFTAGSVEKWSSHDIHALHIANMGSSLTSFGAFSPCYRIFGMPRSHGSRRSEDVVRSIDTFRYS